MKNAKLRVSQAEEKIQDLESRVRELESDFYSWDDPAYRDGVIKPEWDKARADLAASRLEVDAARTALQDLEEDARTSGALPGWLRD